MKARNIIRNHIALTISGLFLGLILDIHPATLPTNLDAKYAAMVGRAVSEYEHQTAIVAPLATNLSTPAKQLHFFLSHFKPDHTTLTHYLPVSASEDSGLIGSKPNSHSWFSFFNQHMNTSCGSAILQQLLVCPLISKELKNRQKIVHHFYTLQKKEGLIKELTAQLKTAQSSIPYYIQMCNDRQRTISEDGFIKLSEMEKINSILYYRDTDSSTANQGIFLDKDSRLNNSALALELGHTGGLAWSGLKAAAAPAAAAATAFTLYKVGAGLLSPWTSEVTQTTRVVGTDGKGNPIYEASPEPVNPIMHDYARSMGSDQASLKQNAVLASALVGNSEKAKSIFNFGAAAQDKIIKLSFPAFALKIGLGTIGNAASATSGWVSEVKNQFGYMYYIHAQLIQLAHLVSTLRKIDYLFIAPNKKIQTLLPSVMRIHNLFEKDSPYVSPEMKALISLLQTNTFSGNSSFFSFKGRILLTYKKFQECYKEFIPLLHVLGEIDAYNGCAQTCYAEKEKWSFVNISQQDSPEFTAHNVWGLQKSETLNHVNVTSSEPLITQTSATWKLVMGAAVMAHTLTIIPCTSATITPCNSLHILGSIETVNAYAPSKTTQGFTLIGCNVPNLVGQALNKLIQPNTLVIRLNPTNL